jgi:hypothetical protein
MLRGVRHYQTIRMRLRFRRKTGVRLIPNSQRSTLTCRAGASAKEELPASPKYLPIMKSTSNEHALRTDQLSTASTARSRKVSEFNDSTNHAATALVAEIIRRRGFFDTKNVEALSLAVRCIRLRK